MMLTVRIDRVVVMDTIKGGRIMKRTTHTRFFLTAVALYVLTVIGVVIGMSYITIHFVLKYW